MNQILRLLKKTPEKLNQVFRTIASKISPKFLLEWDKKLEEKYPHIHATKVHFVAIYCLPLVPLFFLFGHLPGIFDYSYLIYMLRYPAFFIFLILYFISIFENAPKPPKSIGERVVTGISYYLGFALPFCVATAYMLGTVTKFEELEGESDLVFKGDFVGVKFFFLYLFPLFVLFQMSFLAPYRRSESFKKLLPSRIQKLDQYLLLNYPNIQITKIHILLPLFFPFVVVSGFLGYTLGDIYGNESFYYAVGYFLYIVYLLLYAVSILRDIHPNTKGKFLLNLQSIFCYYIAIVLPFFVLSLFFIGYHYKISLTEYSIQDNLNQSQLSYQNPKLDLNRRYAVNQESLLLYFYKKYFFDSKKREFSKRYLSGLGEEDRKIWGRKTYFDENGNAVKENYFDKQGKLVEDKVEEISFYEKERILDENGRLLQINLRKFLKQGESQELLTIYSFANEDKPYKVQFMTVIKADSDSKEVLAPYNVDGVAEIKFSYKKKGDEVETIKECFDDKGKPFPDCENYEYKPLEWKIDPLIPEDDFKVLERFTNKVFYARALFKQGLFTFQYEAIGDSLLKQWKFTLLFYFFIAPFLIILYFLTVKGRHPNPILSFTLHALFLLFFFWFLLEGFYTKVEPEKLENHISDFTLLTKFTFYLEVFSFTSLSLISFFRNQFSFLLQLAYSAVLLVFAFASMVWLGLFFKYDGREPILLYASCALLLSFLFLAFFVSRMEKMKSLPT